MSAKKTLEINPHHSVMKELLQALKDSEDGTLDEEKQEYARILYNMALLNSGFPIDDPNSFTEPLQKLVNVGFGLDRDQAVEEIEIDLEDDEDNIEEDVQEINIDDLNI